MALISQEGFTLRLGISIFESDSLIYPYVPEQLFKGVHLTILNKLEKVFGLYALVGFVEVADNSTTHNTLLFYTRWKALFLIDGGKRVWTQDWLEANGITLRLRPTP